MNTNMIGFRWFSKNICVLVLWTKVASALEGLRVLVETAVWNYLTFDSTFGMKNNLTIYVKDIVLGKVLINISPSNNFPA